MPRLLVNHYSSSKSIVIYIVEIAISWEFQRYSPKTTFLNMQSIPFIGVELSSKKKHPYFKDNYSHLL